MEIKLTYDELYEYLEAEPPNFPIYTAALLNLANQFAQGTRPRVVGQMSELIQEFPGKTLSEWEEWYRQQHPNAIQEATNKVLSMVEKLREAMAKIDRDLVERWVEDLTLVKTFVGLRFQEAILKKLAEIRGSTYRLAQPEEESKGVDGFVGDRPISIKPHTYKTKFALPETIESEIVFYEKRKDGIVIEFEK
jgi:hypothetical protein